MIRTASAKESHSSVAFIEVMGDFPFNYVLIDLEISRERKLQSKNWRDQKLENVKFPSLKCPCFPNRRAHAQIIARLTRVLVFTIEISDTRYHLLSFGGKYPNGKKQGRL